MNPETLTVALGDRSYDIFFGRGIYSLFQEWICRFYPDGTVHVVTDRNVASIYGDDINRWLSGIPHDVLALPPGEEHKSFETVREIYGFLARGDAGRDSLVVAFGGGVVGDLAGFAAATYLRGVSCIQIPTTLLSQVDSSVGGKTGFNLPEGKNLVGAFHQPRAVFIDDAFLLTLDDRNLRAGMAEVVKCALAGDAELWDRLLAVGGKWKAISGEEWRWVVRRAVAFKASVVEKDERETSLRRILNLGHTIGHAMEKSGGYGRLLHGEAVAMGLAWEAILGMKLGVTGEEMVDDLVSLLIGMGFPLDDPGVALTSIAASIGMDKKRMAADVDLPLIAAPGRCELRRVPLAEIRRELPGIRAEIRERSIAKDLNVPAGNGIPEESPVSNLVQVGDEVYEIRAVEMSVSPAVPAEAGPGVGQERAMEIEPEPESEHAEVSAGSEPDQAVAVESEPEEAPLEIPVAPAVRTVTLADLYWSQGELSTARRIVEELLRDEPANLRARAWLAARKGDDLVEAELLGFLETMAKEYGYDLS
ncbi:3-dehydroquinate synthase [Candidatus Deferrimicrobium sp.]|uniref:3-dehydroquinate synthase n=1 Tax=Candidatus Deferrimicrobium sp. TaxID=3060586 RepID=UPI002ED42F50